MIIPPLFKNEQYICFHPGFFPGLSGLPKALLSFLLNGGFCIEIGLNLGNVLRHIFPFFLKNTYDLLNHHIVLLLQHEKIGSAYGCRLKFGITFTIYSLPPAIFISFFFFCLHRLKYFLLVLI